MFHDFLIKVLSTLTGGILLGLLFYFTREKIFPLPDVTGRWYFRMVTVDSSYKPYKGMVLGYVAMLWREGCKIKGTIEKIYENSSNGERSFEGVHRRRGLVEGYIEKYYFVQDRIFLHVIEDGFGRQSTHFFDVRVIPDNKMSGAFNSMIAYQNGTCLWQREPF